MCEPPFDKSEYMRRSENTRSKMTDLCIDVLEITDPANMYYLTGYSAWSFYVHQVVIVEHSGDPTWIGRDSDSNGVGLTTCLDKDNVVGYPEICIESIEHHSFKLIDRYLIDKGYSIGINYPPDLGEHSTSLRRGDKTVLEENMTFHLMPGLWYEDWGNEISKAFRVTDAGGEALAEFSRQLIVKY